MPRGSRFRQDAERRQESERLADLSRQLPGLALQRAEGDRHVECRQVSHRLDPHAGRAHAWRSVHAARRRRGDLLFGSYIGVFALDGATGEVKWTYTPELYEDLVARQTHSPYNRGMAMGNGNLYVGTVDGRLIAIDMKTGKPAGIPS